MSDIENMIGLTMVSVVNRNNEELIFTSSEGTEFTFYHDQDCCESVHINDIVGDLEDLIGSPIIQAEETSSQISTNDEYDESGTWTFYKYATNKGSLTVRWLGTSNGYYSERVDLKVENKSLDHKMF